MILLQTTANAVITWRTYLQDINLIAQIIGTIMVIIYVIYTYKTFAQIKKQTDYQQDAYLKIEPLIIKEIPSQDGTFVPIIDGIMVSKNTIPTKYISKDLSIKMIEILKPIFKFEDNLFEGNYYSVNLTNYGNAEVNSIKLNLNVTISISKEVAEQKMLKENDTHKIEITIDEIIGRNGGKLKIPIISTASFPSYTITLKGEYYDVRNKKYLIAETISTGQNEHFNKLP